ncbi:hypothetical protein H6F98_10570 [Microcoleus sp. FACHB-SPT15]|uniref:hypothetical protein n=1 Tax=Microcoleus sp. FACHB-SPT15 TaxID=2692830 RepID=UPI0017807837|nr:hypothetical protein [Microcoleus sp. FACHB-SPT15]MBD1805892.1 hypothetical protein [Microcoleus sp. FACHB-SPT15]
MLVSTFELLVKPISTPGFGPGAASRLVAQGYFLTIANPNNVEVGVRLQFAATTPTLTLADTVVIRDVVAGNAGNIFGELVPTADPKKLTYDLSIPAHDTVLVTLLPDLGRDVQPPFGTPDLITTQYEIRGYVDISLRSPFNLNGLNVLLTPEHRGTFLPQNLAAPNPDFDQLVYSLPTATGSSLFTLRSVFEPVLPKNIKDIIDTSGGIQLSEKAIKDVTDNTVPTIPIGGIEQMFNQMAERINGLEERIEAAGKSFISPQERPEVGEQVVNNQAGNRV